ncbi:MAG: 16S rRNA (cytosine(1402)-N(4))-methyltransferase RsmH [Ignavibacteria bacterium]|nr:16S rRNA (cytosine(1402)-N(4))-methyltransferase RsmH [Ignavibacteria bacterium]
MTHDTPGYHIPVLLEQATDILVSNPDGVYVDGTLGGGGHSGRILQKLGAGGRLIGIDQDADAIAYASSQLLHDPRFAVVHENTIHLRSILLRHEIASVEGILLDLGMSSRQIDSPDRGFSFQHAGPLDMRMDVMSSRTAADLIAAASREELATILFEFGEERHSRRIADAILRRREQEPLVTTADLADVVRKAVPPPHANKTLARVFQALRIAVNDEIAVLRQLVSDAIDALSIGGRIVVISYHSLEDRIVKTLFRHGAASCVCPPNFPICVCGKVQRLSLLTTKAIVPDENEIRRNPRARSARLRAGAKLHA